MKIVGGYWLQEDMLPQVDDRAVGLIANSLHYAAGIDTPENKAFVDAYTKAYKRLPSWFGEVGLHRRAVDQDRDRQDQRQCRGQGRLPEGDAVGRAEGAARTAQARRLRQPDPERLHLEDREDRKHPVLGEVLITKPVKTYEAVSQFWTWKPEEFLAHGPYKR